MNNIESAILEAMTIEAATMLGRALGVNPDNVARIWIAGGKA